MMKSRNRRSGRVAVLLAGFDLRILQKKWIYPVSITPAPSREFLVDAINYLK
jgi:hypothetical protein